MDPVDFQCGGTAAEDGGWTREFRRRRRRRVTDARRPTADPRDDCRSSCSLRCGWAKEYGLTMPHSTKVDVVSEGAGSLRCGT